MREIIMLFTPPTLTDEAAYELVEFLQDFVLALENHYMPQLRRYTKTSDEESNLSFGCEEVEGVDPF